MMATAVSFVNSKVYRQGTACIEKAIHGKPLDIVT
jgi:hypothetical protein